MDQRNDLINSLINQWGRFISEFLIANNWNWLQEFRIKLDPHHSSDPLRRISQSLDLLPFNWKSKNFGSIFWGKSKSKLKDPKWQRNRMNKRENQLAKGRLKGGCPKHQRRLKDNFCFSRYLLSMSGEEVVTLSIIYIFCRMGGARQC